MTITLRCALCNKERIYHQYIMSSPKKSLKEMTSSIKQDGWSITSAKDGYKCPKCKGMKYAGIVKKVQEEQERVEKKNRKLNLEFIETHRKENEMTTEEIEEKARGEN